MKKKRIRIICLWMAILLLLAACQTPPDAVDGGENGTDAASYPLSAFQIVRPDNASEELTAAVVQLNNAVKSYLGKQLTIRTDLNATQETPCEILIGETARAQSQTALSALAEGDYIIQSVKTDGGVKLIVGGADESFTLLAIEAFEEQLKQNAVEENGILKSFALKYNLYDMYKNYTLELGAPVVVAHGSQKQWGPYQFPKISYTTRGHILVSWAMWNDSIFGGGRVEGATTAVSEDGGKTWREATDEDIRVSDVKMRNGKYFMGFVQQDLVTIENLSQYEPAVIGTGYTKVHFAEDIEGYNPVVYAMELDPATGKTSTFRINLNWPYMPATEVAENTIYPVANTMAINNFCGCIEINGDLYYCTYSKGFDSKTGTVTRRSGYLSVYVFKSTDNARTWNYLSQITFTEEYMTHSNSEGFNEPSMEVMPDGSVVMLMRCGDTERPSYIVRSTDNCETWSKPVQYDDRGVYPQILNLDCGVILSTYGRKGIYIRSTNDRAGLTWGPPMEIELSPVESPQICNNHPESGQASYHRESCCYTGMLALDHDTILLVYTDFHYPAQNRDGFEKAILVRTVNIVPKS